jgi:hypothetical protein
VGAAWVGANSGAGAAWAEQAKLIGTGTSGCCIEQGYSVSMSGDGQTALVDATGDNFLIEGAWKYTYEPPSCAATSGWCQAGANFVGNDPLGQSLRGAAAVGVTG